MSQISLTIKGINNLILFLAITLPNFFLISNLSIQRPLLIIFIMVNMKYIIQQIKYNNKLFTYILFIFIYLFAISDIFNKLVILDLIRLIVNVTVVWFIYYKTKDNYLYFSTSLFLISLMFFISYIFQHFGIDFYLHNGVSPIAFNMPRFFPDLHRVSLAYGPKGGSLLYLGIFLYFYFIRYKHINIPNKSIVHFGLLFSFLLLLLSQTVSGYLILIMVLILHVLSRIRSGDYLFSFKITIILFTIISIYLFNLIYIFDLGSMRMNYHGLLNDSLLLIEKAFYVGNGFGYNLYSGGTSFDSDYSLFMIYIYELGFIPMIIMLSLLYFMNKKYLIYYVCFVVSSLTAHSTDQLVMYSLSAIYAMNLIEHRKHVVNYNRNNNYIKYSL